MKKKKNKSLISIIFSRFLVCIIITLIGLILLKSNSKFKMAAYNYIFKNNFKFAKINQIYEKYFGTILPSDEKSSTSLVSSEKLTYKDSVSYKDGVKLICDKKNAVGAINSGIVVFSGNKEGYGNTIIVEGSDDVQIWYSGLENIKVGMYDYIKKGTILGESKEDYYVLVFAKEGKILDYKKYI